MKNQELVSKIKSGARVKVWERVKEGDKERESPFEGIVIARKHGNEPGATFTVRNVVQNIGVEKIYPVHSPTIRIEVLSSPKKTKRSKLYYFRSLSPKKIKEKMRRINK